ncbi:hypothetical protein AF335_11010 [Streptomyces eurocidicus]|uniref:Uncharacterized protein n=1 Tax=Streptomyces eurocidicus TaxID=66423 RepID=A0A2N8NXC0_STREU|nr:hypothetical protein [Streptomyces eurocidicus]MBB5120450.1 hypothetical protein [Streptomyces eurocidicus]MBF6053663.1 hypothetical protein [Streptomyces eurocidicus]PNE33418.1 hypothetical protein AF335_11010 [Streptomyces eurocidicus]
MLAQKTARIIATPAEAAAIGSMMVEPEATVSDPPLPAPEAAGFILALLLMSPKEPKEPKGK